MNKYQFSAVLMRTLTVKIFSQVSLSPIAMKKYTVFQSGCFGS